MVHAKTNCITTRLTDRSKKENDMRAYKNMTTMNAGEKHILSDAVLHKAAAVFAALGFMSLLLVAKVAQASSTQFDRQMQPILQAYLQIPKALAADKTRGVVAAAKKIKRLTTYLDVTSVGSAHAAHYKKIPQNLQNAASKMIAAKDITAMRAALKDLSRPLAMWVSMAKPQGVNVVYCSMSKGSWVQQGEAIANPYYGAKMLSCGEIVAGADVKQNKGHGMQGQEMKGRHMQ